VKGHQNESVLLENLSIESQLDVRMDETAGLCRVSHTIPLKARTHKGTNITLTINGDIITSNLHSALRFGKTAHTLQNYIMQEQGWDIYIFEMVDWPNFGKYLSSLPFVKQVNVIKMTHNWQYNHSRAMLFEDRESQSCPMECNEIESTLHHLRCKSQPGAISPKTDLHDIRSWPRRTAPPLTLAIMQGIKNRISCRPPPHFPPSSNEILERRINLP